MFKFKKSKMALLAERVDTLEAVVGSIVLDLSLSDEQSQIAAKVVTNKEAAKVLDVPVQYIYNYRYRGILKPTSTHTVSAESLAKVLNGKIKQHRK